jgi:RimJ/RimL family protein N-acetyltransferase
MPEFPTLQTERLILRAFQMDDAPAVDKYVSEKAIAATTLNIPHPYTLEMAKEWIGTHKEAFENGQAVRFAITLGECFNMGSIPLGSNGYSPRIFAGIPPPAGSCRKRA